MLTQVRYADTKGVGLLAYVYPCLPFEAVRAYLIGDTATAITTTSTTIITTTSIKSTSATYTTTLTLSLGDALDLSQAGAKNWLLSALSAFLNKTGAKGFAW